MVIFKKRISGFTLIELLAVLAIISILVAIVTVNISVAKSKSRDAQRKLDLKEIQLGIERYYDKHGSYPFPGTGYTGGGNGWTSVENGSTYTYSLVHKLKDDGVLGASVNDDPTPSAPKGGYMVYISGCPYGKTYSLSATLENPTAADLAFVPTVCNGSAVVGSANSIDVTYGKNYAISK